MKLTTENSKVHSEVDNEGSSIIDVILWREGKPFVLGTFHKWHHAIEECLYFMYETTWKKIKVA